MATVSVSTETRQVPVVKEVEVKTYTLTLSEREAAVIRAVAVHIGGHANGPRGAFDSISAALGGVGVIAVDLRQSKGFGSCLYLVDFWPSDLAEHPNTPEAQTKNDREGV